MTRQAPPRLAARIVAAVLPADGREAVLGDLDERFRGRVDARGRRAARRWYWQQTLMFLCRVPVARSTTRLVARAGRLRFGAGLGGDVRLGVRTLGRRPGLTMTATLVLGLAIGASTAVFSVVKGVLIEALPFPEPHRLVMIWDAYPPERRMGPISPITLEHYREWARQDDVFSAVGAYESVSPSLDLGEWRERVDAAFVTSPLLPLLGARPLHGRLFVPGDQVPGAEPAVVLSYALWADRFGADPGLIGRPIDVNGQPTRVIGVTQRDFWFYDPYAAGRSVAGGSASAASLWLPLSDEPFGDELDYPRYRVIARLQDGIDVRTVSEAVAVRRRQMPATTVGADGEARMLMLGEQVVAEARPRLLGLFTAVALVLLIACVNLVSLLLVHLDTRRTEIAIRSALGAGRRRLGRQLVVESTLLALCGGVAGVAVAAFGTQVLLGLVPRGLPLAYRVGLDPVVVAFGVGLSVAAGVAIGALAALQMDPRRLAGTIASGGRSVAGTRHGRRLHGGLVAVEVALSLVLLIAAALLTRGLVALHTADTGFDTRGVLTFHVALDSGPGVEPDFGFFTRLEGQLLALPGVTHVGTTSALPFSRWAQSAVVTAGGAAEGARVAYRLVSPGYFDTVGLDVLAGRAFGVIDGEGGAAVVVANQAFVRRWLDGVASPVGHVLQVQRGRDAMTATIVGVVENVKHDRLFEADQPILYGAVRQTPVVFQRFAVRVASGDLMALVESIRRAAAGIDPRQSLTEFIAFDDLVGQSIEEERFYALVLAAFAASALIVTLVGIYGVVAYTTRQRDREVGVRLALGAGVGRVRTLVLRQAMVPIAVGVAAGVTGAMLVSRVLQGLLHDVPATDPLSFVAATGVFVAVASAACLMPALRASRVDPIQVLRGD